VDGADSEKVRWYLEDYAEFPAAPAPLLARNAETALSTVGRELFRQVFTEAGALWAVATDGAPGLAGLRVEVDTDPTDVPGQPWELLREPSTDQAVVPGAAEFVRTHRQTARDVVLPSPTDGPVRVLLVICPPATPRSPSTRCARCGSSPCPRSSWAPASPPCSCARPAR
jgi:hypothetical protein